jgi:hypothetical protein
MRLLGRLAHLFDRDRVEIGEKRFAGPAHGRIDDPLEQVLVLLGRKRNNVHIFDEKGQRRTPAELCLLAAREVTMLTDDEG